MRKRFCITAAVLIMHTVFTPRLMAQSVAINSGTTVHGGEAVITLGGNWSNGGAFTVGTSTVILNGSPTQYIGHTFHNLTVDKPGAGAVVMGNSLTITGALTLSSGRVNINWSNIYLGTSGTLSETDGNVVYGLNGRIYATRNLNAPSSENVAGLGAVITSAANLGSTIITRGHDAQTGGGNTGIKRYYTITPANNTALDAALTFSYDESELNTIDESNLHPFRSEDNGGTWSLIGGSASDAGANTVAFSSLSTLSRFTLGSADAPLTEPLRVQAKVFLEGPYDDAANEMTTALSGSIPLTSPYSEDARTVGSIPATITDWVLVQLRSTTDSSSTVASRSTFLRKDGKIVADDGTTEYITMSANAGDYYIVIRHRNHLAVMSAATHTLASGSSTLYDFTTALNKVTGDEAALLKEDALSGNVYGMYGGDTNGSGIITNADKDAIVGNLNAAEYCAGDANCSCIVTNSDKDPIVGNLNKATKVPNL